MNLILIYQNGEAVDLSVNQANILGEQLLIKRCNYCSTAEDKIYHVGVDDALVRAAIADQRFVNGDVPGVFKIWCQLEFIPNEGDAFNVDGEEEHELYSSANISDIVDRWNQLANAANSSMFSHLEYTQVANDLVAHEGE